MDYRYCARFEPAEGGFIVTFPDVPEALTQGEDRADARASAAEALGLALRGYLAQGRALPPPRAHRGLERIAVPPADALKLAVIEAFTTSGIAKTELAARLGRGETEARRILDPDHATKLPLMVAALAALGKQVSLLVADAA